MAGSSLTCIRNRTLFDNESDKPFTLRPWKGRRVAAWKQKDDGTKYMQLRLSDRIAKGAASSPETEATPLPADDIPF